MASPGTEPFSTSTSRRATIAWAKVATNRPMAIWLGLSCRNVCTMRGENCPMANCTTTMVIVNTSAARLTIEAATVDRMAMAMSGPPVKVCGISSKSVLRSTATVANDKATPATTQTTGTNHRPFRMLSSRRKVFTSCPHLSRASRVCAISSQPPDGAASTSRRRSLSGVVVTVVVITATGT